jgi:hypothetical protein
MKVTTTMIESDFSGNNMYFLDCPGYRAFKRAYEKGAPWYRKLFSKQNYAWLVRNNIDETWGSYRNGESLNMVVEARVGDEITFVKL